MNPKTENFRVSGNKRVLNGYLQSITSVHHGSFESFEVDFPEESGKIFSATEGVDESE